MQIHVVVGIWQGVIEDIEAFSTSEKATEYEKTLCEQYKLPFDAKERKEHISENEVYSYVLTVDEWRIADTT